MRSTFVAGILLAFTSCCAFAQSGKDLYPRMAPLSRYLIDDQNSEIALARSAGPPSIAEKADVLVLGKTGYRTAIKGGNGFVCLVQRSWAAGVDDPEFWNPAIRAPICLNAAAAHSFLPHITKKTEWALAGLSKTEITEQIKNAFEKQVLTAPEPGAMCYMMSKQGYLSDRGQRWHPHLMFFAPLVDPASWGAVADSPLMGAADPVEHYTLFLLPVSKWSDGTQADM